MMSLLTIAEDFLRQEVAPKAQEIDFQPALLQDALAGLSQRGLMALRCPADHGGPAADEYTFRTFQELTARYSGALAFLQTQHQSAGSMIAKSSNEELKREYLPLMVHGERLVGIGFSQLRRPGAPLMRASATPGGYELNGEVPWITGYGFYGEFVVGATLEDGRALFAVVPFTPTKGVRFSEPMRLAAMESARTVSGHFEQFFVPDSKMVYVQEANWIRNNDEINIALQGYFALGCAQAGLDILSENAHKKPLPFLQTSLQLLTTELTKCREETQRAQRSVSEETTDERLRVRAWAIDLAVQCAHAAVVSSSGAANALSHPAQRVYREALVFSVSAQTSRIMEASLERICRI